MLTGTPLDLTPFGGLFRAIGTFYWLCVLAALLVSLWLPKRWWAKLICVVVVLGIFVLPVALYVRSQYQQKKLFEDKRDQAMARFEMLCKKSGEKITRTVENVDGVFLMKLRPEVDYNVPEQFRMNDPYGHDYSAAGLIGSFLLGRGKDRWLDQGVYDNAGYQYVEAISPDDGKRYRYTGHHADANHFVLKKTVPTETGPRYGVTFDDISTVEDRKMWIAGSSLRVIDLQTNEVIAERIGYMIDLAQGSKAGGRDPWAFAAANACPAFPKIPPANQRVYQAGQTRNFVEKVLKLIPKSGKQK